jgi:urease accessory protein
VAVHVRGATVPGDELMVALSVLALGAVMLLRPALPGFVLAVLFGLTGLLHGYALGESIAGAEPTPLLWYFIGLAVIQSLIALAAFKFARLIAVPGAQTPMLLRGAGAVVAAVGAVALVMQVIPGA